MKLTVKDRILLTSIMPTRGKAINLMVGEDVRKITALEAKEREAVGLKVEGTGTDTERLVWDETKDKPVDVQFSQAEVDLIWSTLKDLDAKGDLTLDLLSLYERFNKNPADQTAE